MRYIVKYKLHGKEVPWYIEDGGYLSEDGYHIGITKDDYDCYIPSDLIHLTIEELKDKFIKVDYKDKEDISFSKEDKEIFFEKWLLDKGLKK